MLETHPILNGLREITGSTQSLADSDQLFSSFCAMVRDTWLRRPKNRWPSAKNWTLRVAPDYSPHPTQRLEKQLQKQIAICLENDGWGNDVPTASGLMNSGGRQMNVDLAHRIPGGFELVELKVNSNNPYEAAFQVLRYGAIYILYRTEPELASRYRGFEMLCAKRIILEVLAPRAYFRGEQEAMGSFEDRVDKQVRCLAGRMAPGLAMEFRFMAFPETFHYIPGMDRDLIREAIEGRRSPFQQC